MRGKSNAIFIIFIRNIIIFRSILVSIFVSSSIENVWEVSVILSLLTV